MGSYVITGGAGGMGEAIAWRLSRDGNRIVLIDIDSRVEALAQRMTGAHAIVADLSDHDQADAAVERAFEIAKTLDGAVLAAGMTGRRGRESRAVYEFDRMVGVNARGALVVSEAIASRMAAARTPGSLVLISSAAAFAAVGMTSYSASKAAVEALAREMALTYAEHGIRINTIAPGVIDTQMSAKDRSDPEVFGKLLDHTPLKRIGQPEEVAGAAAFLLSEDAGFITATTLRVDGGYLSV